MQWAKYRCRVQLVRPATSTSYSAAGKCDLWRRLTWVIVRTSTWILSVLHFSAFLSLFLCHAAFLLFPWARIWANTEWFQHFLQPYTMEFSLIILQLQLKLWRHSTVKVNSKLNYFNFFVCSSSHLSHKVLKLIPLYCCSAWIGSSSPAVCCSRYWGRALVVSWRRGWGPVSPQGHGSWGEAQGQCTLRSVMKSKKSIRHGQGMHAQDMWNIIIFYCLYFVCIFFFIWYKIWSTLISVITVLKQVLSFVLTIRGSEWLFGLGLC